MNNRMAILKHSLELFSARGFEAVGVQEIVDAAGITKPTLYHYFGSKQGLLQALLDEHFRALNREVGEAADYQGNLTLNLVKITKVLFGFARTHRTYYRLQLALWFAPQESEPHQLVANWYQQQYQKVEEMFENAVYDHGNMRGRHRAYGATLIGMINTYIGLWLNGWVELNDELVYQVVHQFEHGIYS